MDLVCSGVWTSTYCGEDSDTLGCHLESARADLVGDRSMRISHDGCNSPDSGIIPISGDCVDHPSRTEMNERLHRDAETPSSLVLPPTADTVASVEDQCKVVVADSPVHGRGVFTVFPVGSGDVLGTWPILRIDAGDPVWGSGSIIETYVFEMTDGSGGLALGLPSLLNHSDSANCKVELDEDALVVMLRAVCDLDVGDECFIDYGPDYWA